MSVTSARRVAAAANQMSGKASALMPVKLDSYDDLLQAVRELLLDARLEVSVVTPLIYSLLETFIDDSRAYPFDEVSMLLSRLELDGYPAHALRELIIRIAEAYKQYHGEAIQQPAPGGVTDDEFEGLRQSVMYAAMIAEQEYQQNGGDPAGTGPLLIRNPVRRNK